MSKSYLFLVLSITCLLVCSCNQTTQQPSSPKPHNVILILVDDLGWTDLAYNGSSFHETPHIDELSRTSFNFTNAYAAGSVCSPSRAAIMTGKHPVRADITDWLQGLNPTDRQFLGPQDLEQLPLEEITLAEVLESQSYKTFFSGKWHLGGEGYHPEEQGFEINIGGHDKGTPPGGYYTPYKNPKLTDGPEGEYLTDRLTTESINFLEQTEDDPFFMMLSFYTVHTPIQPNLKHLEKFENKLARLDETEKKTKDEGRGVTVLNQVDPAYASMVYAMDENVGRLMQALKAKGLYDNSTIIFTSDNGGLSTLDKKYNKKSPTSVLPLRGGKGWLYEGGIRVPLLIKPAQFAGASVVIDEPVIGHDLFPTICAAADVPLPNGVTIDGQDLSPILSGEKDLVREQLFWHYPHYHGSGWTPGAAIRKGDWKLIEFYADERVELYNLKEDISEANDLSKENPEKLKEMRTALSQWQTKMNAKFTTVNPDFSEN